MNKIYYLIAMMLMISCDADINKKIAIVVLEKTEEFEITMDTFRITSYGTELNLPFRFHSKNFEKNRYYLGRNSSEHTIDIVDMKTREYEPSILLQRGGPNNVGDVRSLFYQSYDSLFILTLNNLLLINHSGEVIENIELDNFKANRIKGLEGLQIFNGINNKNPIYFRDDKIYYSLKPREGGYHVKDYPIIGFYDLNHNSFDTLSIHHPASYENKYFGFLDRPNVNYLEDRIFVNYPIGPDVYIYDLQGQLLKQVTIIDDRLNSAKPFSDVSHKKSDQLMTHLYENPFYQEIIPINGGEYFFQKYRSKILDESGRVDPYIIFYNGDFTKYSVTYIDIRSILFSNGYGGALASIGFPDDMVQELVQVNFQFLNEE